MVVLRRICGQPLKRTPAVLDLTMVSTTIQRRAIPKNQLTCRFCILSFPSSPSLWIWTHSSPLVCQWTVMRFIVIDNLTKCPNHLQVCQNCRAGDN
uniref:Uncharacterized protein n=1 Tax=Chromera velia CCMP2878 TaxID=1169474 RepID=A0A0G4GNM2_9ALVE|eukprot:Cvel_4977.t1-p1 / transcript=Cvel_4977.t1 / gene=Cvel_4977 / organism=Chromera_velia_CCMP2878 / gene_product=hypothetical protein / transcript_product=hypothetical protein / location=Cvel_scaffold225:45354-47845(+) / protein_length=95 / sequence_SO=supercontig / SO=protein_coding / is_pseudo=false